MKICILAGARPNFMKVAPIIRAVSKARESGREIDYELVYAGSQTDHTIEDTLFEDLQIHRPNVYLGVESSSLNEITGQVMSAFDKYLNEHPAEVVIVVDDLASTMAAAIVAKKLGLTLCHLVAGTRSFNIDMPKEVNRLVIDGLSDLLFTAGMGGNSIVTREGAEMSQIYMVGNILMDTLRHNRDRLVRPACLEGIGDGEYLVFTLNRKALISNGPLLSGLIRSLLDHSGGLPVISPLRGAARTAVAEASKGCPGADRLHLVEPLSYLEFGYLTAHAKGIVTDSGNVAEEATFNMIPCLTLNSYTEHAETYKIGSNVLVGEDPGQLAGHLDTLIAGQWKKVALPDRWDGRSAERIVQIIIEYQQAKCRQA